MKYSLITLIFLITIASTAQEGKNFIDQNYIEVTGKSEMEVVPDMIYLKILLNEKDTKNKISLSELEKKMTNRLQEIGIDIAKDLLVKDISSNFKYYLLAKKDILLSKEYQLLVRDGLTASKIFIELEEIGISNISVEKLDHTKIVELRKKVKINAIKVAKEKAQSLARAINQDVGRAIYVLEQNFGYQKYRSSNNVVIRSYGLDKSALNEVNMDIDFEKIKLEYSILCRFELK